MSWYSREDEITYKLRGFLYSRIEHCHGEPPIRVAARLKNISDLIAELDDGGIQVKSFSTVKTKEQHGKKMSTVYTITKDTLPASSCFTRLCLTENKLDFSTSIYEISSSATEVTDKNFGFIFRFLGRFEKTIELLHKYRADYEKQKKATEFTMDSYDTWLDQICKKLTMPYFLEKGGTRTVLGVLVDQDTQLEIAIPYKKFQEIMPEVMNIIQSYEHLRETCKARVLIKNCRYTVRWKSNPSAQKPKTE
jgi:hypothetical protein